MFTSKQIEELTNELRASLGDNISWKYEEKSRVMLSEFAQNKSDVVLDKLRKTLTDEWHYKTVKRLPNELKQQLGNLSKLTKNQKLLALPATNHRPAMVAFWWPWDHGGTYSLRITLLEQSYENTPIVDSPGVFSLFKKLFTSA